MHQWHAIGIFCEDVRDEKQSHSLIGVMSDNVNVPAIPGMFPKLGIYVRINVSPSADIGPISLKLHNPNGTQLQLAGFDADFVKKTQQEAADKGSPWAGFMITGIASPFPIEAPGIVLLVATLAGEEVVCAVLNVQLIPSATASVPPA